MCSEKFNKFHKFHMFHMFESLFNKVADPHPRNFINVKHNKCYTVGI